MMQRLSRSLFFSLVLTLVFLLAVPAPVYAAGSAQGRVIFGESVTISAGESVDGDLVVFGGSVTIEDGAVVRGDVAVFGGTATVAGEIIGDLVVMGGSAELQADAIIHSDVITMGGQVKRHPNAQILGQVMETPGQIPLPNFRFVWEAPFLGVQHGWVPWTLNFVARLVLGLAKAIVLAALAALLVLVAEEPTRQVGQTALKHPLETGGVGMLTLLAVPVVVLSLAITIVGIPLALALGAVLGLAALFGWLALAVEIGDRLVQSMRQPWAAPASAALGAVVLYVVVAGADLIPCVGWLVGLMVVFLGLGSVALTRFGTHPYPRNAPTQTAFSSLPAGPPSEQGSSSDSTESPETDAT